MEETNNPTAYTSFLGTGWGFPPAFSKESRGVMMTSDEEDIHASLVILFGTSAGERFMNPKYGLNMRDKLFEPMSTSEITMLRDRIRKAILVYEPRISILSLDLDTSGELEGRLIISLSYEVKNTNSRFNLVYPFYSHDSNEVRNTLDFDNP